MTAKLMPKVDYAFRQKAAQALYGAKATALPVTDAKMKGSRRGARVRD